LVISRVVAKLALLLIKSQQIFPMQYNKVLIAIASFNLSSLVNFYSLLLEQEPKNLIPSVYAEFKLPSLQLSIFRPKATHEWEFATSGKSPLSLCMEVNNLEEAISQLTSLGYPFSQEIYLTSSLREIYAYDPDNNRLILYEQKE